MCLIVTVRFSLKQNLSPDPEDVSGILPLTNMGIRCNSYRLLEMIFEKNRTATSASKLN